MMASCIRNKVWVSCTLLGVEHSAQVCGGSSTRGGQLSKSDSNAVVQHLRNRQ